ncbi:MAG: hypothetical protein K2X28_02470 [Alphaproteobacteria bacterium]|nr:hypothetical protein [Alphaproteobacteria bacterium]
MKKLLTLFSCVFFFGETHACLNEAEVEYVRAKHVLRGYFDEEGNYRVNSGTSLTTEVESELRALLSRASDMRIEDDEVQYNLASFLISQREWEKKLEGLGLVARLALRQGFCQTNSVYLFGSTLSTLHEFSPESWRGNNFSTFFKVSEFFETCEFSNKKMTIKPLYDAISRFLQVFTTCPKSIREHPSFSSILDASVQSIMNYLGVKKMEKGQVILHQNYLSKTDKQGLIFRHMTDVLQKNKLLQTPFTKGLRASSLMTLNRYQEAKPIYDDILGKYVQEARTQGDQEVLDDLYMQTLDVCFDNLRMALNYSLGGFCYARLGQDAQARGNLEEARNLHQKAKNIYDVSLELDPEIGTHLQRTRSLVLLSEYGEACDAFKKLIAYPASKWRSLGIEKNTLYKEYASALQKAGDESGVTNLLLRQQQRILEKGLKHFQLVKDAVLLQRQQVERKEEQKAEKQRRKDIEEQQRAELREQAKTTSFSSSSSSSHEPILCREENRPRRFLPPTYEKHKPKTKGTPSPAASQEEASSLSASSSAPSRVNVNTLLKGTPLKIFNKIFERERSGVSDKKVKIYLSEVETLMTALGQSFDPSSGKGSHTKVTLDLTNIHVQLGEANPLEVSMMTLAKHDELKPYQIKQLREMFKAYGLYPEDMQ